MFKNIKYLGINLTKNVKDLYSENNKTLKKVTEEDTNKQKHIPCSQIGRINIIKISIPPEAIFPLNVNLISIPMASFTANAYYMPGIISTHPISFAVI